MSNNARIPLDEILNGLHPTYQTGKLKLRLVDEGIKDGDCEQCGCPPVWCGQPLVMHLDHVDGNPTNHRLVNLRILCPNCHSQTPTYCGRNKKVAHHRVSDETLCDALSRSTSISSALALLGLRDSVVRREYTRGLLQKMADSGAEVAYPEIFNVLKAASLGRAELDQAQALFEEAQRELASSVRNAGIDMTAFGWVSKVAKVIGKHPQKVHLWMKRYMPAEFALAFHRKRQEEPVNNEQEGA